MIKKIDSEALFDCWKKRDLYSIRILSLLKSYGCKYQFCSFYRQEINGKITAILSKLDNNVTLALDDGYDREELVHFFCITGYSGILTSDEFELSSRYDEGAVMVCHSKHDVPLADVHIDEYPKLMDLFNFVDYSSQDFKAWYVDISHRVRHQTAKAYTLNVDGEIVSSGILSSIYDGNAVLTAVRTKDEYQRMGYGSKLVNYICADVTGAVYIMRDWDLNEEFYQKIGFENAGKWRMYR